MFSRTGVPVMRCSEAMLLRTGSRFFSGNYGPTRLPTQFQRPPLQVASTGSRVNRGVVSRGVETKLKYVGASCTLGGES